MNPYTGHLVAGYDPELLKQDYEQLPAKLEAEAKRELDGKSETTIDLKRHSPLQKWAKMKRKERAAAKSRRINRKK